MNTKSALSYLTCLLTYSSLALAAGGNDTVHLSGNEVSAIILAARDFKAKKHSTMGDLRHFTVDLKRQGKEVEVIFVPDEPKDPGPNDEEVGGRTRYGYEVHYHVGLTPVRILRVEFAR